MRFVPILFVTLGRRGLSTGLTLVYALTIDWSSSNLFVASFQTLAIGYLLWGVADVIVQLLFLIGFRLLGSSLQFRRLNLSRGVPPSQRTALAYMLRANHGAVVMEVNSSPGIEGIENATGIDVAGKIMDFIEKNQKPGRTKTRGKG